MAEYAVWWCYCPECDEDYQIGGASTQGQAHDAYLKHMRDKHGEEAEHA